MTATARHGLVLGSAVAVVLIGPGPARGQYVIQYKTLQSLRLELHSLRDDVTLYAGNPQQLLELKTHPEDVYPHIELGPGLHPTLRIRDQVLLDVPAPPDSTLADEEPLPAATTSAMPESHRWEVLLSPPAPTQFLLRCERGSGRFDFSDLPVKEVQLIGVSAELEVEFRRRNLVPLERCRLVADGGSLVVRGLLNGRPRVVTVQCPQADVDFQVAGKPFDGVLEIYFEGAADQLRLHLSTKVGMQVSGPTALLSRFDGDRLQARAGALVTPGYDDSRCKVRLYVADAPRSLEVAWE